MAVTHSVEVEVQSTIPKAGNLTTPDLDHLYSQLRSASIALDRLTTQLMPFYKQFPKLFPKSPEEMSASDRLAVSQALVSFGEHLTE